MKSRQCSSGFGSQFPPDETFVRVYFLQQGSTVGQADRFYCHYKTKGWLNARGRRVLNWKRLAWIWIFYREPSEVYSVNH
jgi:hypothetical protein